MIARIGGTVVDGELELDEPVPWPPRTRVTITIEPVSDQAQRQPAWERFQRRVREQNRRDSRRAYGGGRSAAELF
jgi:hypothetical protein